jgi:hypothetical protein
MKNNENLTINDVNEGYVHSPELEKEEERENTEEMRKIVEQFPHAFKKVESKFEHSNDYYILRDPHDESGIANGDIILSGSGITIVEEITRFKEGGKRETVDVFPFEASDFGDYTMNDMRFNAGKYKNNATGEVKYIGHDGDEFTHFGGETYNVIYHQYDFNDDSFSDEAKQKFLDEVDKVEQRFKDTDFNKKQ